MTTGAIYARYSSHNQRDASIEQQIEACTQYAQEQNIRIVEVYADRAISGRTDNRPNFQRMMRDAERGNFQYVIAWKSNRIGRNMLQAMQNETRLNGWGIRCLYTEEDFDNSAAGRFALRSMMNVNQFYSENMAEDIRRGMMDNASNCMVTNGNLPYGYKAGDDLKWALDPPADEIVREIFQRFANGDNFATIARNLNERGITTKMGNRWNKGSFHALLRNERYTGVYAYNGIRIEGGVPRIISDELFAQVQTRLGGKPRMKHSEDYLLTGKLFCGKCNSPMIGLSGHSKSGTPHHYYTCQNRRRTHGCDKKNVRRDTIENTVATVLKKAVFTDEGINDIAEKTAQYLASSSASVDLRIAESALADNKRAIKNIMSAIEQGIITETTKSRLLELEREQEVIHQRILSAKSDVVPVSKEDIVAGLTSFRDGDIEDKEYQRALFDLFIVAVYVYDDELHIYFSFSGKKYISAKITSDTKQHSDVRPTNNQPYQNIFRRTQQGDIFIFRVPLE